jgi:hypothetical protein
MHVYKYFLFIYLIILCTVCIYIYKFTMWNFSVVCFRVNLRSISLPVLSWDADASGDRLWSYMATWAVRWTNCQPRKYGKSLGTMGKYGTSPKDMEVSSLENHPSMNFQHAMFDLRRVIRRVLGCALLRWFSHIFTGRVPPWWVHLHKLV